MSNLNGETYYGKISKLTKCFNKLDLNKINDAIALIQPQRNIEEKNTDDYTR